MSNVKVNVRFDYFNTISASNKNNMVDIVNLLEQFKGF